MYLSLYLENAYLGETPTYKLSLRLRIIYVQKDIHHYSMDSANHIYT